MKGGLINFDEAQRDQASKIDGRTATRPTELGGEVDEERAWKEESNRGSPD
jgi:hypothetical protein